ncbi:MAG: Calx-beta domain-containing protein [Gemmataceae bacterium]
MRFRTLFDFVTRAARPARHEPAGRHPAPRRLAVERLDDRIVPAAQFSIGDATILEGNTGTQTAVLTVTLSGQHGNNTTVNYATADGTAASGSDYTGVSGKLTFGKNETTKTILVPVRGDRVPESNETFSVRLSNPKGAQIARGTGTVGIEDDEPWAFATNGVATEGNAGSSPLTFAVILSAAYDVPVTVNYATADGTAVAGLDYTAASGTLTFAPGQTRQEVTVAVLGDRAGEQDERFSVGLTTPNSHVAIGGAGEQTIVDNEPRIGISDTYLDTNAGTFTFFVSLQTAYDQPVTVDFVTADGTAIAGVNYAAASGTLTFQPGQTGVLVTVTALTLVPEYDLYFTLNLSNASANAQIWGSTAYGYWYYDPGWWG